MNNTRGASGPAAAVPRTGLPSDLVVRWTEPASRLRGRGLCVRRLTLSASVFSVFSTGCRGSRLGSPVDAPHAAEHAVPFITLSGRRESLHRAEYIELQATP